MTKDPFAVSLITQPSRRRRTRVVDGLTGPRLHDRPAVGLDLDDEGFDASVLSEFRTRVVAHGLEQRVLELLLEALVAQGLVAAGGKQRTDSTHVICAVGDLNRLELAGESVRACVEASRQRRRTGWRR